MFTHVPSIIRTQLAKYEPFDINIKRHSSANEPPSASPSVPSPLPTASSHLTPTAINVGVRFA